jgi:hypothetical protein
MRKLLVCAAVLALVGAALAFNVDNQRPEKAQVDYPPNVPDPDRQGGDTIMDAVEVTLPVIDGSGTTVGYTDDYDEACPYEGSTSPDVVYTFTPEMTMALDIDLCGSDYDTKVYVYDAELALIACNDDYYGFGDPCGSYVSRILNMGVTAGVQYFVIVDGYGGDAGNYVINITEYIECELECPAGAELEGEPPLGDGYVDNWNGGCNSEPYVFQPITQPVFCGMGGWFVGASGADTRDTDWFVLTVDEDGVLEVTGEVEQPTDMYWLSTDCDDIQILGEMSLMPCEPQTMTITGEPGEEVWFFVGGVNFTPPPGFEGPEFDYVLNIDYVIPVQQQSFSAVKSLFK